MPTFAQLQHSTVRFWQLFLSPSTPLPGSRVQSHFCSFRSLCIRRSHFGNFCSIAAFDCRILVAFPLTPPLHPVLAYDRNFVAFTHSQNSTVAFWQRLLFRRIRQSHFGSLSAHSPSSPLSPVLAYDRIFAPCAHAEFDGRIFPTFAPSPHLTVAFWQLFLSPHSPSSPLCPVLAYDLIFAVFTHSQHSTVAFSQLLPNCSIRQSHFSHFSSLPRLPGTPVTR